MAVLEGKILGIETIKVSRKSKGLDDTKRTDLLVLEDGKRDKTRIQVRLPDLELLDGFKAQDRVQLDFNATVNEFYREGEFNRIDNNVLNSIIKLL
ncbi:conserved hypothetical protein [Tenacibaculum sp. 190524A05c]|uniref:hypothetical protein n=1 Tax=Tenacibaculum platacis TaxID=3137852 RepID=UPI0031FA9551